MRKTIGLIAVLCMFLISCSHFPPEPPEDTSDIFITMKRTACYGPCPVYTLDINGDGSVSYNGDYYVSEKGPRSFTISEADVKAIVEKFYEVEYFTFDNIYTESITDLPTTTTSITINGATKEVTNHWEAPDKLIELENFIDQITGVDKWFTEKEVWDEE